MGTLHGRKNHWAKRCRSEDSKDQKSKQKRRPRKKFHAVETQQSEEYESDGGTISTERTQPEQYEYDGGTIYTKMFHSISKMCLDNVTQERDEAFATLKVRPRDLLVEDCVLRLKIDGRVW